MATIGTSIHCTCLGLRNGKKYKGGPLSFVPSTEDWPNIKESHARHKNPDGKSLCISVWSQPIGLHLFVNIDKARRGFRLHLIPVQGGEGGSARPPNTVGGKRSQPKAPPLRKAACGCMSWFNGSRARAPAPRQASPCCCCLWRAAVILSALAGQVARAGGRQWLGLWGQGRGDSPAHPKPTLLPGEC